MVSNKAAELIDEVVETEFAKNAEGGYVNMCKAIEDMMKEAEAKGAEKKQVENAINFYKNGVSLDIISKSINMSIDDVKNILVKNNVKLRTV